MIISTIYQTSALFLPRFKVENDETMEEADEAMTAAEGEYNVITGADITELPSTDA